MQALPPLVRVYRSEDLGSVVGLWERAGWLPVGPDGLRLETATDLLSAESAEALVAERDGELVGVALASVTGAVGVIHRLVGEGGTDVQLLDRLEARLAGRGARRITVALRRRGEAVEKVLIQRGYDAAEESVILEREIPRMMPGALEELGGSMISPGLWDELRGMDEAKRIIERRVILPLAEPALAARHGVRAPRATILFGPPGTGKTTFAKGIASRLGWPYVPIEPAQLGESVGEGEAASLARVFGQILALPSAVAFVDEVEDIASLRETERRVSQRVTNEFLRQIPKFRELPSHLLVCATNWVGRLDPAFLRPGRFDYVLPVGPPDATARSSIWRRYIDDITDEKIDLDAIVAASERFTPADIEYAARQAAQLAFEREHAGQESRRATTEVFLEVIDRTRPTLDDAMIKTFLEDREQYARY